MDGASMSTEGVVYRKAAEGGLRQSQIARATGLSSSTVSRHIQNLLKKGHIAVDENHGNGLTYKPGPVPYKGSSRVVPRQAKRSRRGSMEGPLYPGTARPHELTASYNVQGRPTGLDDFMEQRGFGVNPYGQYLITAPEGQRYFSVVLRKSVRETLLHIKYFPGKKGGTLTVELYQEPFEATTEAVEAFKAGLLERFRAIGQWWKNRSGAAHVSEPEVNQNYSLAIVPHVKDASYEEMARARIKTPDGSAEIDASAGTPETEYLTSEAHTAYLYGYTILNSLSARMEAIEKALAGVGYQANTRTWEAQMDFNKSVVERMEQMAGILTSKEDDKDNEKVRRGQDDDEIMYG